MGRLRPAVEEYEDLRSVLDALDTGGAPGAGDAPGVGSAPTHAMHALASSDGALDAAAESATVTPPERNRAIPAPVRRPRPSPHRARTARRAPPAILRPAPPAIDAAEAILAALEHGSHTLAELGVVTDLPAGQIRESVRGLRSSGRIVTAEREGRTAYALAARVE